jgi:hypothetical protein
MQIAPEGAIDMASPRAMLLGGAALRVAYASLSHTSCVVECNARSVMSLTRCRESGISLRRNPWGRRRHRL